MHTHRVTTRVRVRLLAYLPTTLRQSASSAQLRLSFRVETFALALMMLRGSCREPREHQPRMN
jgi:hypothetical protein